MCDAELRVFIKPCLVSRTHFILTDYFSNVNLSHTYFFILADHYPLPIIIIKRNGFNYLQIHRNVGDCCPIKYGEGNTTVLIP